MDASEVAAHWEANAESWTRQVRDGHDVYRDALNTPAFLAMLPAVDGLRGLDIGCGEGANTRRLARLGARMHAIDIAPSFIRHALAAEREETLGISYCVANAAALPFEADSFDFATAFMSLMDMPEQARVLAEAHRVLRPGGFLQFSILHPCFVPPHRRVLRDEANQVTAIEIADYFATAKAWLDVWWFGALPRERRAEVAPFRTPRFHMTLSRWVEIICEAGLLIERFGEPSATEDLARAVPEVADTRVAPLFLHIRARKPGDRTVSCRSG